jgi:hypothetical protein
MSDCWSAARIKADKAPRKGRDVERLAVGVRRSTFSAGQGESSAPRDEEGLHKGRKEREERIPLGAGQILRTVKPFCRTPYR